MQRLISTVLQAWAERRRARRRRLNLRAGTRPYLVPKREALPAPVPTRRPGAGRWVLPASLLVALAGALLIAGHARYLAEATISTPHAVEEVHAANVYQSVLPGAVFSVPAQPGVSVSLSAEGALLVASGLRAAAPVRVDLCSQLRGPGDARLSPLRLGYRFDDVKRWVAQNQTSTVQLALRNVLLVNEHGGDAMPEVQIGGVARADFADPLSEPLQLGWRAASGEARWISDASFGQVEQGASGQVALRQQGWLMWGAGSALRIERRANALCPQAGELVVQIYRQADDAPAQALVVAFPARGKAVSAYLAPGRYQVPAAARAPLEDQMLFKALQDKGLVRLDAGGAIELAPPDLPQWLTARESERVGEMAAWRDVSMDAVTKKLFERLYYQADGAYVRQQIDIYNGERRLLAWRGAAASASGAQEWRASLVDGAASSDAPADIATTSQMPAAATRLFADLPQGWRPWTRVASWPQVAGRDARPPAPSPAASSTPLPIASPAPLGGSTYAQGARPTVRLALDLPRAATGGETLQLLLAGRVAAGGSVQGATLRIQPACSGRACKAADDVQQITLTLHPGARRVQLDVQPLDFSAPEDQKYRHLKLEGGRLVWQPLQNAASGTGRAASGLPSAAPSSVALRDRNGTPLWADGVPTPAAIDAGLAPLLGISADHASSIAGMLSRLPASSGAAGPGAAGAGANATVNARLTLDLPLQALSQRILDCIGMQRGRWDGKACSATHAAPASRHAGIVILDTETGDILAAAGSGAGTVNSANWTEVRDFDRTNPARSPLRLPALQHDGGAHQSPGSTFKVVSALGLELAAQHDPQIDALLTGMPLPAINRLAQQRGFGFQTDAASYPTNPRLAHITNYREQSLDRRAQEGRLGLAQALTYSLNTWFAWSSELSDNSLFGRPDGGAPDLQALDADALDGVRPIVAAAHRLGFEQALRLDGGLLPADFNWHTWDALQATPAHMDPIHTRHELRQMAIGLRMQVTPLQMALASAAIGQGQVVTPRLLLNLGSNASNVPPAQPLGIRLDRIRAGMKGVVDVGTGAGAFGSAGLAALRPSLYGKTGTAPSGDDTATVWFTGWLEPGSLPGQTHRLAVAAFASHSDATGGEHAAPIVAAILSTLASQNKEQKGK